MDVVIVDNQVSDKLRKICQEQVKSNQEQFQNVDRKKFSGEPAKVFHPSSPLSDQVGFVGPHRDRGDTGSHLS